MRYIAEDPPSIDPPMIPYIHSNGSMPAAVYVANVAPDAPFRKYDVGAIGVKLCCNCDNLESCVVCSAYFDNMIFLY